MALDLASGKKLWKARKGSDQASAIPTTALQPVTFSGRFGSRISGMPIYIGDQMLCMDDSRIYCYLPGAEEPVPKDPDLRKRRGKMLANKFGDLDVAGQLRMIELGKEAAPTLIDRLVEIEQMEAELDYSKSSEEEFALLDSLKFTGTELLEEMCGEGEARALKKGSDRLSGRGWVKYRLDEIEQRVNPSVQRLTELVAKAKSIVDGTAPDNTHLVFYEQHGQPKYSSDNPEKRSLLRKLYAIVRNDRHRSTTKWKWEVVFVGEPDGTVLLKEGAASDGAQWQLFESYVLGSNDLYIRRKLASGFGPFVFLGIQGPRSLDGPTTYLGQPVSELIGSGEWLEAFPSKADIHSDADADGLSDLVEERLSTNKDKKDTDSDGVDDYNDRFPLTVPHGNGELGDRQKIIAAIISDVFLGSKVASPSIVIHMEDKPFEVDAFDGVLLWPSRPLWARDGILRMFSFESSMIAQKAERGNVTINVYPSGKRARTVFYVWLHSLNASWFEVTLEKIDGDWFVVEALLAGQS
jgi:hypothetical protein